MQVVGLQAFIQPLCVVPVTYVRPRVATGNRKHGKIHHDRCSARSASTDSQLQKSYQEARKSIESLVKSGIIDKYIIDSVKELSQEGGKRHFVNSKKLSFKNSGLLVNAILDFDGSPAARQSAQLIQRRGFKTKAQRTELDSDSSLMERIPKRFLNLRKYIGKIERKDPASVTSEWVDAKNLTPEEKSNVRLAFLEGYVTGRLKIPVGSLTTRSGKRPLYYKVFLLVGLVGLYYFLTSSSGGVVRVSFSTKKSLVSPEDINVTFQDVCGVDEAKQELQEIVEFLRDPQKFSKLGGKLPRGVLLVGPPGTGKTLLARAVAGEAGVPFFHAAGPEFDEILVGQGARRVRDLFSTAKIRAPCVVFIDEIDSVGGKRTNSVLHPYANQTINQLLSEMDGFHQNEGVIVLGATNRREDLDRALLRPGRFDVEVQVPVPDLKGREEILSLYLKKVKLAPEVEPKLIAKRTVGFTGADLENLVNQAALRAAIENQSAVSMKYFELARDRALMGPERKNKIMDEEENRNTAYHEAGHALVSLYTKDATPLHKVTILQRGSVLGHTAFVPEKDIHTRNKSQLLAMMDCSMGGRVSEELIFGAEKVTSGASQDFKSATSIATTMVKHYGMSEKIGVRFFEENDAQFGPVNNMSDSTNELIDSEIKRLLQESYDRAKNILKHKAEEHRLLAEALLKYETLDAEDVKLVIQGKNPVNVHA